MIVINFFTILFLGWAIGESIKRTNYGLAGFYAALLIINTVYFTIRCLGMEVATL